MSSVVLGCPYPQLCAQLQSIALDLVAAFDVPEFLLGDIAGDWVANNRYDNEDPA